MHDPATGAWVGWGPGDADPKVSDIKAYLRRMYKSYAGGLDDSPVYNDALVTVVKEAQKRLNLPVTGIFNYATQVATGYVKAPPPIKPLFFTVEGHMSNMFAGPVADTATILEKEGRCHHQPIGYQNGSIPFDNASGENGLADLFGRTTMDNGVPFPLGTKFVLAGFSQGAIVVTDFIANYLQPDQTHAARAKDCLGVLMYGNPCRSTGSVAPWSRAQAGPAANSGMDPKVRLDKLGIELPYPLMDVYRKGDIFSDNEPTKGGEVKSAVYEAVARGDIFSNPYSLCAEIADLFTVPVDEVLGIFKAIISGIGFLAHNPNPHYSPYDITGGVDWMRGRLS